MDGQTDGWTDRHTGKNNMSPNPSGGDIIRNLAKILLLHGILPCVADSKSI